MKQYIFRFIMVVAVLFYASCGKDDDDPVVSPTPDPNEQEKQNPDPDDPPAPEKPTLPASLEAVDLGLPSGTKWANLNLGAENPEDFGMYYRWGDTTSYGGDTKDGVAFIFSNYVLAENGLISKYCPNATFKGKSWGVEDGKLELEPEDDAAQAKWGDKWVTPGCDDFEELINYTTNEWTTVNGVTGRKFTSKLNGNSIFLPAAGARLDQDKVEGTGAYWTSMVYGDYCGGAYGVELNENTFELTMHRRFGGISIRPVFKASASRQALIRFTLKDNSGAELPVNRMWLIVEDSVATYEPADAPTNIVYANVSAFENKKIGVSAVTSTGNLYIGEMNVDVVEAGKINDVTIQLTEDAGVQLWKDGPTFASVNLGAASPTDCGLFLSWGAKKSNAAMGIPYDWTTTSYYAGDGEPHVWSKYNELGAVLDPADDAAHVLLGGDWRTPTAAEVKSLMDEKLVKYEWTQLNGKSGYLFTGVTEGYTDKSIFMCVNGTKNGIKHGKKENYGHYWSTKLSTTSVDDAIYLAFQDPETNPEYNPVGIRGYSRFFGISIRPVR